MRRYLNYGRKSKNEIIKRDVTDKLARGYSFSHPFGDPGAKTAKRVRQPSASFTSHKRRRCGSEASPRAMEPPWATKTDDKITASPACRFGRGLTSDSASCGGRGNGSARSRQ